MCSINLREHESISNIQNPVVVNTFIRGFLFEKV